VQGKPPRSIEKIRKDILALEKETEGKINVISATSCGRNYIGTLCFIVKKS